MKRSRIGVFVFLLVFMALFAGCGRLNPTTAVTTAKPNNTTQNQTTTGVGNITTAPLTTADPLTTAISLTTTVPVTTTVPSTTTTVPITTTTAETTTTEETTTVTTEEGGYFGDSFDNPITLSLNTVGTANIDVPDKYLYYRFVPTVSGFYTIESFGEADSYVELYDSDQGYLYDDDESGVLSNFVLTYELTAGETYYYVLSLYYTDEVGTFTFELIESPEITFVVNGGSAVEPYYGTIIEVAPEITKDGYFFGGWYENPACTGTSVTYPYITHQDTMLYAFWTNSAVHDGKSFATAYVLTAGQNYTINISREDQMVFYLFTPTVAGSYTFQSTGEGDTYGWILDTDQDILGSNDEAGTGSNFLITMTMEAGVSYYLVSAYYYAEDTGSFVINLSPTEVS